MKVVFVAIGVESLAIELLSSYLKRFDHQVEAVFDPKLFLSESLQSQKLANIFDIQKELVQQIVEKKPDLIGFSVFTINYQRALFLASELKKIIPDTPIIFGGVHPTSVPEFVIKEKPIDIVCVGEGEDALVELLDNLKNKKINYRIRNLWFKDKNKIIKNPLRPLISNLDTLPFPDKDLFYNIYPGYMDDYYTISSRGCPFACTYCANNVYHRVYSGLGKTIRRRSPKNIIDELYWAKNRYHSKKITFVDDLFVQDINWLKKFALLYKKKINLPYVVLTHPKFITDKVTKILVNSGCYFLLFGIQSASEKTRSQILNRFETNDQIRFAAACCHHAGLNFSIDHIFNIPGEGVEEYDLAIKFYNELRPSVVNSFWLQYFPGTEIINTALKQKILTKTMVSKINHGLTSTSFVVGFGNKDTINPELLYTNIQFYFMLLPILSKSLMNWIINKRLYATHFRPPLFINITIKFFVNLIRGRGGVYIGIIKSIFYFIYYDLSLKIRYRN